MLFRARQFEIIFPRPALVMGIVNVTPDSFSDGGKFFNSKKAIAHGLKLIGEGAEILDIGGESTRPNAKSVSEKEELRRVIPVIEKLSEKIGAQKILLSIDTMKPAVARAALQAGASIVNDIAASRRDNVLPTCSRQTSDTLSPTTSRRHFCCDDMLEIISEFRAGYICMHAPPTLHKIDKTQNITRQIENFFLERLKKLTRAGISPEQIIFDPGVGFGKTLEQHLQLLAKLRNFTLLQRPVMLGVSRKSFIAKLLGSDLENRLAASLACATLAIVAGAKIIRAHDVAATVQAVRMTEAVLSKKSNVV